MLKYQADFLLWVSGIFVCWALIFFSSNPCPPQYDKNIQTLRITISFSSQHCSAATKMLQPCSFPLALHTPI